jgi:hypothetical protein
VVETRGESTEAKYLDVHGQLQGFILMGKAVAQKNAYLEVMQRSDKCA